MDTLLKIYRFYNLTKYQKMPRVTYIYTGFKEISGLNQGCTMYGPRANFGPRGV